MSAGTERVEGEMGVQGERARPETDLQGTRSHRELLARYP